MMHSSILDKIKIKDDKSSNESNPQLQLPNLENSSSLAEDSYSAYCTDNSFIIFESVDRILYLIYSTKEKSIISFNLLHQQKINEKKNAHNNYISNFRHYSDTINKRDLLLSLSPSEKNVKLWNIKNFECLYDFFDIYQNGYLRSACFLNHENNIYVVTSHYYKEDHQPIKILNLNGQILKEINDSKQVTYLIDVYLDPKKSKTYIVTSNQGFSQSFDFNENKIYFKYDDNEDTKSHHSFIIFNNNDGITQLIDSSEDGNLRIWNFHTGEKLNIIKMNTESFSDRSWIIGICLWNKELLYVGSFNNTVILVDLTTKKNIKKYYGHDNVVLTVKKLIHPFYGECLISQAYRDGKIIIRRNNNLLA